jgi:hypothetical protein
MTEMRKRTAKEVAMVFLLFVGIVFTGIMTWGMTVDFGRYGDFNDSLLKASKAPTIEKIVGYLDSASTWARKNDYAVELNSSLTEIEEEKKKLAALDPRTSYATLIVSLEERREKIKSLTVYIGPAEGLKKRGVWFCWVPFLVAIVAYLWKVPIKKNDEDEESEGIRSGSNDLD